MMRVPVGVLFATLMASSAFAADWAKVASTISKSVVYIESAGGSCTGFVINDDAKDGQDYVLTAAHCDGNKLYADGAAASVIYRDAKTDLMVLAVADLGRPAVKFAKSNPTLGQDVASLGYGWGLEHPMFRTANVSEVDTMLAVEDDKVAGPFIVIDAVFVGGQSGGAVVGLNGEVVMIVQRGGSGVGLGIGVDLIMSKVRRYVGK